MKIAVIMINLFILISCTGNVSHPEYLGNYSVEFLLGKNKMTGSITLISNADKVRGRLIVQLANQMNERWNQYLWIMERLSLKQVHHF